MKGHLFNYYCVRSRCEWGAGVQCECVMTLCVVKDNPFSGTKSLELPNNFNSESTHRNVTDVPILKHLGNRTKYYKSTIKLIKSVSRLFIMKQFHKCIFI